MERTYYVADTYAAGYDVLPLAEGAAALHRCRQLISQPRAAAPDFTLRAAQGGFTRLSDLRDRPVILTFLTPSGWLSRTQVRGLNEIARTRLAVVLGVAAANRDALCGFAVEKRVRFLLLSDPDRAAAHRYEVTCLPTTFCIDAEGRIAATHRGLVTADAMLEWIAYL